MPRNLFQSALVRRLLTYSIFLGGIFVVLSTSWILYSSYRQHQAEIANNLEHIALQTPSLASSLYDLDRRQIEIQLEGLLNLPGVVYLEVLDTLDLNLVPIHRGNPAAAKDKVRIYPLNIVGSNGTADENIGQLTAVIDLEYVYRELKFDALTAFVTSSLGIAMIIVAIFLLFHFQVIRYLLSITEFTSMLELDQLDRTLLLNRKDQYAGPVDEVDKLVIAINDMRTRLKEGIEEQRLAHEKSRQSEANLRALVETIPDLVWVKDSEGRFIFCNPRFEQLLGAKESEIVGKTDFDFVDAEQAKFFRQRDLEAAKRGGPTRNEERVIFANDGHEELLETIKTPMYGSHGELVGILGIARDITEQKQTEHALRRSQKMDAIGQLTGGIAHDFNNILGIIIGNLDFLKLQIDDKKKALDRIETLRKSASRATDLTRQLLGFSREQPAKVEVTNINLLIKGMDNLISRSVTPQVVVEQSLAGDLWLTKIDSGDFEDAILNLVLNARDAMSGKGQLTLETRNCTLDSSYCRNNPDAKVGDYLQLSVSDNGPGIPYELQDRIFEPFFTTKEQGKGTGLGLAMVYGFAKRSGGSVKVYSEPGIGTTFRLYMPRIDSKTTSSKVADYQQELSLEGNEVLLVVDDEIDLLELAQESLIGLGYQILVASDAEQAIYMLTEHPEISLMFSDVIMPGGMNGYELAEQAVKQHPDLKVLLTSGYTQKVVVRNGQARFDATLLSKPYTQVELAQRIREILNT